MAINSLAQFLYRVGRKHCFIWIFTLIFFPGCSSTTFRLGEILPSRRSPAPPRQVLDHSDPWSLAGINAAQESHKKPVPAQEVFPKQEIVPAVFSNEQNLVEAKTESESESESESDPSEYVYLEELIEMLSKDSWIRNHTLQQVSNQASGHSEQLRRREELNRLNMSAKEARKRDKNRYDFAFGRISDWRWYHKELESLSKIPVNHRPDTAIFFQDKKYSSPQYRILQVNAAILMARDGVPLAEKHLLNILSNNKLRDDFRCAAVEAFGSLSSTTPEPLINLLESEEDLPEKVHAEILHSLAGRMGPWEHPCFLEPLFSGSGNMRLETAKIWRHHPPGTGGRFPEHSSRLPERFLQYAKRETEPLIRVEIIHTLGAWKEPDLLRLVRTDLHQAAALRNAAMEALADAGCVEAIPLLKEKLRDPIGKNRAKALESLRKLGATDDVLRLHTDKDRLVRIEVAKALEMNCTEQSARIAKDLLADSEKVQQSVLDSIASWPAKNACFLYAEALTSTHPSIRHQAVESLVRYLPEMKEYDPQLPPKSLVRKREEILKKMESMDWSSLSKHEDKKQPISSGNKKSSSAPSSPDAMEQEIRLCLNHWKQPGLNYGQKQALADRLVEWEDQLLKTIEKIHQKDPKQIPPSFDAVLARTDRVFAAMIQLDSDDSVQAYRAATELHEMSRSTEFCSLHIDRILHRAVQCDHPRTILLLLETLEQSDPAASRKFAYHLLDSDTAELRRRGCEALKQHGRKGDLVELSTCLDDPSRPVVRAALESITEILIREKKEGIKKSEQASLRESLKALLCHEDTWLQIDAAAALHALGHPTGAETLWRLSLIQEVKQKVYLVQVLVKLDDPAFIPILIRGLDDHSAVRKVALEGLAKLARTEIGRIETDTTDSGELSETQKQVMRWKQWWAQNGHQTQK